MTGLTSRRYALLCGLCGLAFAAVAVMARSTPAWAQGIPDYAAIVADLDRSDADRAIDKRRDPVKLLAFTGVRLGMKVLDMGAGGGYSTELLTRAVGPTGIVYGQNPPDVNPRAKERFETRLNTPAMGRAVALVQPFDDPLPPGLGDFDLITFFFYYHDTTYMAVDRAQMNRKLYAALKPGGMLVIADHSAKPGEGVSVGKTWHRIEESVRAQRDRSGGLQAGRRSGLPASPGGHARFLGEPADRTGR